MSEIFHIHGQQEYVGADDASRCQQANFSKYVYVILKVTSWIIAVWLTQTGSKLGNIIDSAAARAYLYVL